MASVSKKGLLILNYIPVAAISSSIITPALPNIETYYKLSVGQLEWVVSLFLIGYMLGQLIYGPWANVVGRVYALRVGMIISLVGLVICYIGYLFPFFWLMLFGRFINAIGAASGLVCGIILINEELDHQEAKTIFAYSPIAFSLGVTFAIFLGGIISHWLGWQYTLFFLFLYSGLMLYLTYYIPEGFNPEAFKKERLHKRDIKVSSSNIIKLICLSFIVGTTTCFTYCYTTAAPLISKVHFGYNPSQYGIWNLINVFGVLIGGLSMLSMVKFFGGKKSLFSVLALSLLVLISFLLIFLTHLHSPAWFFFTSSFMYIATSWGYSIGSFFGSNAIANRALGSSILSFINIFCAAIGVIILGYLSFDELLDMVITGAIFLTGATCCLLWLIFKTKLEVPRVEKK